ncbi:MAG: T9SS type A sorting domain-containing protein [Candidatus Neomarinimicrobiota bacterium]|nr:T9SS type A sorting domain-containing protein [Candidatus Neomarinimicrobiota bacterium]
MKNIILSMIFLLSINQAAVSTVKLENTALKTSKGNVELNIQADQDIMGIQFDIQYNNVELKFNGANAIPNNYVFEYKEQDNGVIRGIMFSLEGMKLNKYDIESLISFDFTPVDNFDGISTVEFLDVIIAGENGFQLESNFSSIKIDTSDLLPNKTNLNSSYPNPFNPVTKINYDLANDGYVSIGIFDVLGRQVSELINKVQPKGNYDISWDAADQASGTYFIRMMADDKIMTEKIILIK